MFKIALVLLVGLLLIPVESSPVVAAEVAVISAEVDRPVPVRRQHRRIERRYLVGCPDGYSCYPLYGAYGPYGGRAYWTAYTAGARW